MRKANEILIQTIPATLYCKEYLTRKNIAIRIATVHIHQHSPIHYQKL